MLKNYRDDKLPFWKERNIQVTHNISLIIPLYNSGKTILSTLKGLESQTRKDFEVIVVNDGSTDDSAKLVKEFKNQSKFPIKLIHQNNSGPAKARNLGVKHSSGDLIVFLDSDCIPVNNWVEEMTKPLNGEVIGCACGYNVRNKESLIARHVDYEIAKRHEKLVGKNVDTIGSYSASFLKGVFLEANGFSAEYEDANAEDFDLAFRIRRMGYNLTFTDKTFVYHCHPDSLRKYLVQQFGRGYWRVPMYLRNREKIMRGDSYTGYEAQSQFLLSSIVFFSIPLMIVNPMVALSFGLLLLSNLPLGLWAFKKEKKFVILAPILASMRSLAGTLGVYKYFIRTIKERFL